MFCFYKNILYFTIGRVARAGRNGTAYSLVASDEIPFLLDLHLFLDRPLQFARTNMKDEGKLYLVVVEFICIKLILYLIASR